MCVCLRGFLCLRVQDAKDVVMTVIVPSLASLHLVEWCSGFDQHSLNRSRFV